jgi:hypothetical protein
LTCKVADSKARRAVHFGPNRARLVTFGQTDRFVCPFSGRARRKSRPPSAALRARRTRTYVKSPPQRLTGLATPAGVGRPGAGYYVIVHITARVCALRGPLELDVSGKKFDAGTKHEFNHRQGHDASPSMITGSWPTSYSASAPMSSASKPTTATKATAAP